MLIPRDSRQFKRDVKMAKKRGKDMAKLRELLALLIEEKPLPAKYRNHPLKGDWVSYWDAHLESDWVLIYRVLNGELLLARTGTHQDVFSEY